MSLDVEILSSTLLSLVQGDLQEALNTNCFPTFKNKTGNFSYSF